MNPNNELIVQLSKELSDYYHRPDLMKAKQVAQRLATMLGEPTPECVRRYVHSWILIWETRSNLEEAIRLQNLDIERKRAELECGDYDAYPHLICQEVEYLQDSLYLQAMRYEKLGNRRKAIDCLREVYNHGKRYGIGPDEDTQAMYVELMASGES